MLLVKNIICLDMFSKLLDSKVVNLSKQNSTGHVGG